MNSEPSSAEASTACRKCGSALTAETRLHLWDARDYCRACVEKASPVLLEMAENRARLLESLHIERSKIIRGYLWALLPVTLFFCSIFMWYGARLGIGEMIFGRLFGLLTCAVTGGLMLIGIFWPSSQCGRDAG